MVDELWALIFLCPLFCCDLRASVDEEFSLVDASDAWRAEVSAQVDGVVADEMFRQRLTKAVWSRLLSPWRARQRAIRKLDPALEVPEGEEPLKVHPLWTAVSRTKKFVLKQRHKIRRRCHINLSELEAFLEAEDRKARRRPSAKHLIGSDSQVVHGAIIKGRSSSSALDRRLRRALPNVLAYNAYSGAQYISTDDNVSDDPTRDRPVRDPNMVEPDWLVKLSQGVAAPLDEILREAGVADEQVARLPEPYAADVAVVPSFSDRELRRQAVSRTSSGRARVKQGCKTKPPVVAAAKPEPWLPRGLLSDEATALLDAVPSSQFVCPRGYMLEDIRHLPGHLDLFSGSRGAARALANKSGRWVLCYDILHDSREDLLDLQVQQQVEQMMTAKCFLSITAGPVCASFSRAVCPAVRSRAEPLGVQHMTENMREKVSQGNAFADWMAKLVLLAMELLLVGWIENPATSFLWWHPKLAAAIEAAGWGTFTTDYALGVLRGANARSLLGVSQQQACDSCALAVGSMCSYVVTVLGIANPGRRWQNLTHLRFVVSLRLRLWNSLSLRSGGGFWARRLVQDVPDVSARPAIQSLMLTGLGVLQQIWRMWL